MSNLKLVERAFLINLSFRDDRKQDFFKRYPENSFLPEIEVWPAIHGDTCQPPDIWVSGNGAWGCLKSHIAILEYCLNNNISSYVVFEDDAQFRDNFVSMTPKVFADLPENWQQFYLGGQLIHERQHPPIKKTELLYQPYNVNRTHCFAVSEEGMLPVYRHISNLPFMGGEHIDHHLGRLHETFQFQVFCPNKWLVGQGGTSSNISGRTDPIHFWTDPEKLSLQHWLIDSPVCLVLRCPLSVRKELKFLHSGYNLDSAGLDKGLSLARKMIDPIAEINKWYSFVQTEVIRNSKFKLPCLFHPLITDEMLSKVHFTPIFIEASNIDSVLEQIHGAFAQYPTGL
jgi:hypothetical protein